MKKFLIGCLAVFVLVGAVGGYFAYRYIYQPARQLVQSAEKFSQIADLEKQIQNLQDFINPNDNLLSPAQVERFMAVQNQMRESLKEKMAVLESKYKELENKPGLNILETLQGYGDMLTLIIEAKKAQIQALNAQGFSLKEYIWVKEQVIAAAGIPFKGIDWSNPEAKPELISPQTAPQPNIDLVAPFKERLEQTLGLSFFGL
jgi:hypothetical protein